MLQKPDWQAALGQAYIVQRPDVESSIQRLRAQARQEGILQSTPQQQVILEPTVIRIVPAEPEVIFVPVYDPALFWGYGGYYGPGWGASLITFGSGFAIGAWLNRDWDWYGRGPYYHGWSGGGWIGANRRFVNTHNHLYVNDQFRNVNVNRMVVNRNIGGFRNQLDRDVAVRQQAGAVPGREDPRRGKPQGEAPPVATPQPRGMPPAATP